MANTTTYINQLVVPDGSGNTITANLVDTVSGYTKNLGTVTAVTASGALTSSGGTTPAITHNKPSTSPAKTTQALYPIKIDEYGHITAAGTAVTSLTPTSHSHGNISDTGTITSTAITPSGTTNAEDYILLSDSSNSGKIERGIKLGSDTSKLLSNNGTWKGIATHTYTKPTGSTTRTADVALNTTTVNSITDIGALPALTITPTNVVTGGTTTAITPVTSKTVVTGVTPNTVVTGGTTTDIPNVTGVGTMFAASYDSGTETLTLTAGSPPTLGTAIAAYTGLSTDTSATVTTGASINTGTAINAYTSLTTSSVGSASDWSAGTLPTKGANTSVATTVKTQPTFSVGTTTDNLSHTLS